MKILLFSVLSFFSVFSFAQANQFPANGNVVINNGNNLLIAGGVIRNNLSGPTNHPLIIDDKLLVTSHIYANGEIYTEHDFYGKRLHLNDEYLSSFITAHGDGRIIIQYPNTSLWVQGIDFYKDLKDVFPWAGIGAVGNATTLQRLYVTHGADPSTSTFGIQILPNGNTGIGTISPTTKLEINTGSSSDPYNYGDSGLRLTHLTSDNDPTPNAAPIGVDATGKVVRVEGGSSDRAWLTTGNNETTASTSTYGNDVNNNFLGTTNEEDLVIATYNKERLRISTTGRLTFHNNDISPNAVNNLYVGGGNETSIGVNNYGNTAVGLGSLPSITSTGNRNLALGSNALIRTGDGDSNIGIGYNSGVNITSGSNNIIIGSEVNAPISAIANNQLNIGNWIYGYDGKIAIGNFTNVPQVFSNLENADYQLIVKNGIKTEKVRVELSSANGWPDYVFETDYRLMPLEELETFVSTNKHLPNIPSAEEVKKNGIDLAEMDAKLLEKIEELTLYNIDLYNENKSLKEENEQQQKLLDDLLKRVGQLESGK